MTTRKGSAEKLANIAHTRIEDEAMIQETYELGEILGEGAFGKVHKARHKDSGIDWAIKAVNKEKAGSSAVNLLEREVAILKQVDHEHIIRLNEVLESPKRMFLVMELCEGGELAEQLKVLGQFSEIDTKHIITKLASAVAYLHKKDIVHRDIKPENILLSQNPDDSTDRLHIKLTDFGLSVVKGGYGHDNMMQAFCGTPIYMSPEIIDNKTYSQQCDVWAMGVITYMLLCGLPPFYANDDDALYELIKKAEVHFSQPVWANISEGARQCIQGMLKVDPAHRLTASEVLYHSWITGESSNTTNVLEMMKLWKDELRIPSRAESDSAITDNLSDVHEPGLMDSDLLNGLDLAHELEKGDSSDDDGVASKDVEDGKSKSTSKLQLTSGLTAQTNQQDLSCAVSPSKFGHRPSPHSLAQKVNSHGNKIRLKSPAATTTSKVGVTQAADKTLTRPSLKKK